MSYSPIPTQYPWRNIFPNHFFVNWSFRNRLLHPACRVRRFCSLMKPGAGICCWLFLGRRGSQSWWPDRLTGSRRCEAANPIQAWSPLTAFRPHLYPLVSISPLSEPWFTRFDYLIPFYKATFNLDVPQSWQSFNPVNHGSEILGSWKEEKCKHKDLENTKEEIPEKSFACYWPGDSFVQQLMGYCMRIFNMGFQVNMHSQPVRFRNETVGGIRYSICSIQTQRTGCRSFLPPIYTVV